MASLLVRKALIRARRLRASAPSTSTLSPRSVSLAAAATTPCLTRRTRSMRTSPAPRAYQLTAQLWRLTKVAESPDCNISVSTLAGACHGRPQAKLHRDGELRGPLTMSRLAGVLQLPTYLEHSRGGRRAARAAPSAAGGPGRPACTPAWRAQQQAFELRSVFQHGHGYGLG